jgi:hypothetical protein
MRCVSVAATKWLSVPSRGEELTTEPEQNERICNPPQGLDGSFQPCCHGGTREKWSCVITNNRHRGIYEQLADEIARMDAEKATNPSCKMGGLHVQQVR